MTGVQSTLDAIDAVLAERDATALPPVSGPEVVRVEMFADELGLELAEWQRQWLRWIFGRRR